MMRARSPTGLVPVPFSIVTVPPLIEHTAGVETPSVTGNPDVAAAATGNVVL